MKSVVGYRELLADRSFEAFLWTQLSGAFNDNVFKMIVSVFAVSRAVEAGAGSRNLALAGAVFVVPFLLFAGYAGYLADRFSKTRVLQITKAFEIVTMLLAVPALFSGRIEWLLLVLFLLAAQANFFGPAKYGILPEMLSEAQISRANGLLELTTFVAIVVGTSFGTLLYEHYKNDPLRLCLTLIGIALAGSAASLGISKVPAAASTARFNWNPFHEILEGARDLRSRRPLALSVLGQTWFWFVGALFQMALLLHGTETLHVSETRVGLLVTALAIGIGVGSLAAGTLSGDHIELSLVPMGSACMGLFSLAAGLTTNYEFTIFTLIGVGFGGGLFAVPLNAYLQEESGTDERGRLMATNNFATMVGVILASAVLWLLHDLVHWTTSRILAVLGIVMLLGSVVLAAKMIEAILRFTLYCAATTIFRIRIEGRENIPAAGPALIVSNHISYADSVLVGCSTRRRPMRFVMWQPIYDNPLGKPFFRALRTIPIDSRSPKLTVTALRTARAALQEGELVMIFPEGGITRTGEPGEFTRGYERVLQGTNAPVIPIFTSGLYGHPLSCKGGGPFRSWEKLWRPTVTVRIGPPIHGPIPIDDLRRAVLTA